MSASLKKDKNFQAGVTLIELVIFIVVVSVGIAGVLSVINNTTRSSADPMVRKQLLSIAEAMMDEIVSKDYQNDASDPGNTSATLGCTSSTTPLCRSNTPIDRANYNDVTDYNGWNQIGITDVDGNAVAGLSTYTMTVTVTAVASWNGVPAKLVAVTVGNNGQSISLQGYRTNYD
jgi:MSHA pilin protein MshD